MTRLLRRRAAGRPDPDHGWGSGGLMRGFLVLLARLGLLLITVVTFVTSFDAVAEVAVSLEAVAPELGWTIPLALDGLIVVGSAVLWTESLEDRWHAFPLATVAAASVLSVTANVAHAGSDVLLGQVLAGVPPVALIVAVELAAWQLRRAFRRTRAHGTAAVSAAAGPAPAAVPGQVDQVQPAVAAGALPIGAASQPSRPRSRPAGARRGEVAPEVLWPRIAAHVADHEGERPSQRQLAAALGVGRGSVQRAIDANRDAWAAFSGGAGGQEDRVERAEVPA